MRWTVDCSVPWSLTVVGSRWWMASPDVGDRFMVPNILLVQPFNSLFFPFIVHVILQTIQKHEPAISLPLCNLVISWCMFSCMPQVWRVEVPNLSWSEISFYNEGLDGVKRKILSQKIIAWVFLIYQWVLCPWSQKNSIIATTIWSSQTNWVVNTGLACSFTFCFTLESTFLWMKHGSEYQLLS